MNLFLAIYEEHKARTGHDIYGGRGGIYGPINCNVCLHLNAVKRDMEKAEAEYFKNLEAESHPHPSPNAEGGGK